MIVEHIKFVLGEKIELMELTNLDSYDEGYLDALDYVLNLIEAEECEVILWSKAVYVSGDGTPIIWLYLDETLYFDLSI